MCLQESSAKRTKIAYSSYKGVALKVPYHHPRIRKGLRKLKWLYTVHYFDSVTKDDGMKELGSFDPVGYLAIGADHDHWYCLVSGAENP